MPLLSRRKFIQTSALATTASTLRASGVKEKKRKNVLFIGVDDQNVSLGCYGESAVKSPHLDALASRGIRFSNAHCQYPLCGPSRASLMTGRAPDSTRIYDLSSRVRDTMPDVVTLGQLFRKNGYYSARVGKIYHQDVPAGIGQDGLDDPATWDYVFNPQGEDHPMDEPLVTNFTPQLTRYDKMGPLRGYARLGSTISFYASPSADRVMTDSMGADEAIRLLSENQHRPFFIAFGLYRPHVPWIVPRSYFDQYPIETIQPRSFNEGELSQAPRAAYTTLPANYGMNELQCREAIRGYYASASFMDTQVGRVLAELKRLGLEKSTIVVFWADHGWSLGEHGQWQKLSLFESSTHVPLILAGPGIGAEKVCQRTVELLDIYPTLAEICNLHDTPTILHGTSLASLLRNPSAGWNRPAITQVTRPPDPHPGTMGYSIRNERYRYTVWQGGDTGEELYDYQLDPREARNVAHQPELQTTRKALRDELELVTQKRGRSMPLGVLAPEDSGTEPAKPIS